MKSKLLARLLNRVNDLLRMHRRKSVNDCSGAKHREVVIDAVVCDDDIGFFKARKNVCYQRGIVRPNPLFPRRVVVKPKYAHVFLVGELNTCAKNSPERRIQAGGFNVKNGNLDGVVPLPVAVVIEVATARCFWFNGEFLGLLFHAPSLSHVSICDLSSST